MSSKLQAEKNECCFDNLIHKYQSLGFSIDEPELRKRVLWCFYDEINGWINSTLKAANVDYEIVSENVFEYVYKRTFSAKAFWKIIKRFDPKKRCTTGFKGYLHRIIVNRTIDWLRKQEPLNEQIYQETVAKTLSGANDLFNWTVVSSELTDLFSSLNQLDRIILKIRFILFLEHEITNEDVKFIADRARTSPAAVRKRLNKLVEAQKKKPVYFEMEKAGNILSALYCRLIKQQKKLRELREMLEFSGVSDDEITNLELRAHETTQIAIKKELQSAQKNISRLKKLYLSHYRTYLEIEKKRKNALKKSFSIPHVPAGAIASLLAMSPAAIHTRISRIKKKFVRKKGKFS